MANKKYKLIRVGKMPLNRTSLHQKQARFYQLQALRDIPEHDVKAGDLGGYVTNKRSLSHEGSCWVGGEAQIVGAVIISENAYIGDNATVHRYFRIDSSNPGRLYIQGNARITGDALVETFRLNNQIFGYDNTIEGNAEIYGKAVLHNIHSIKGNAQIYGSAFIHRVSSIDGNSEVFGNARVEEDCVITGDSKILDNAKLGKSSSVRNSVIAGTTDILPFQRVADGKLSETVIGTTLESLENPNVSAPALTAVHNESKNAPLKSDISRQIFKDVQDKIASYETDIVKLIKYPAMVDKSIPETLAMTAALTKAERLAAYPESDEFHEAVESLEQKFFIAESNALKTVSTLLSDEDKKKTEKARDLLAIAADEASSENEKKQSFKQAFKQLEGVIAVPEVAVDTFRVKIGLQEIEA